MSDYSVQIRELGKMYRLYARPMDKVWDALGLRKLFPGKKHRYQEFWALRDLNIDIKKGERVGIIGRNGAGKSTLLKVICGNLAHTEGDIQVQGKIQALLELGTGFHPEFSGRENIRAYLSYQGLTPEQISAREGEIVDFSELSEFIEQPLKTYSAGMYARLAFSTATAVEPEILIIDEILGAGDAYFAGKCVERMEKITKETGATVLFVSHDMSSVQRLCSRCIWIEHGVVKMDGKPLTLGKAYYQQVQEEENKRLCAQAQGVKKGDAILSPDHIIFRFCMRGGGAPGEKHKIRRVSLKYDGEFCSELLIGSPMDNDLRRDARVLTSPGYVDWSEPGKDSDGFYRYYCDCQGIYRHAPFEFMLPDNTVPGALLLEVESEVQQEGDDLLVEMYDGDKYVTLGQLVPEEKVTCFSLDSACDESVMAANIVGTLGRRDGGSSEESLTMPAMSGGKSIVTWKEADPRIINVQFLDGEGQVVNGILEGDDLTVRIFYFSSKPVAKPVFAITFYLPDGQSLVHANSVLAKYEINKIEQKGYVDFTFPRFAAGPCELMMSCSIFEYLDPKNFSAQPPFYDQHDRQYRLRIWKQIECNMNLGLLRSKFEVSMSSERS